MATSNTTLAGVEARARFAQRLERLTVVIGTVAAIVTAIVARSARLGGGVAVGMVLAWLNCRGLNSAVGAIARAAIAQTESIRVRVPTAVHLKAVVRYLLIGLVICVTVVLLKLPFLAVLCGLFALGAAAMVEGFYQVFLGLQKG